MTVTVCSLLTEESFDRMFFLHLLTRCDGARLVVCWWQLPVFSHGELFQFSRLLLVNCDVECIAHLNFMYQIASHAVSSLLTDKEGSAWPDAMYYSVYGLQHIPLFI